MHVLVQMMLLLVAGLLAHIPAKVPRRLAMACVWRTGDMILFRTTDVVFRLSSIITRSEFSHIGVVVAPPVAPAPMIIESLDMDHHDSVDVWTGRVKAGPQLHPLRARLREYRRRRGGYAVVRRLRGRDATAPPLGPAALERARQFCLSVPRFPTVPQLVQSAGTAMLAEMYSPNIVPLPPPQAVPPDRICCSAVVAQCYLMWGIMRPTVACDFIYPKMFAQGEDDGTVHPKLGLRPGYSFSEGEELHVDLK